MIDIKHVKHYYYLFSQNIADLDKFISNSLRENDESLEPFSKDLYEKIDLIIQKLRMVKKGMARQDYVSLELTSDFTSNAATKVDEIAEEINKIAKML